MSEVGRIYVLPLSGPAFAVQVGFLELLAKCKLKPTHTMANSGGNISAYIAMAGDWNREKIHEIAGQLESKLLMKPWNDGSVFNIPSMVYGFNRGSEYNLNPAAHKFFKKLFKHKLPTETEIWTGVYNKSIGQMELHINKSTTLDMSEFSPGDYGISKEITVTSDPSNLADVVIAAAGVPMIIPSINICGNKCCDGGLSYASPLTPLCPVLSNYAELHITYINCCNTYVPVPYEKATGKETLEDNLAYSFHTMTRYSIINDIRHGHNLLGRKAKLEWRYDRVDAQKLLEIEALRNGYKRTFLELYPKNSNELNLCNFTGHEVQRLANYAYTHMQARLSIYE